MRKRHVMVTMASPSIVLQGMVPEPGDLFEDAPTAKRGDNACESLPASLEHTSGCRGVESHAAFTGNHMYAWFDDDEALASWYSKQCDRFATSEHRTANSEQRTGRLACS